MFVVALFSLLSVALAAGPCCPPRQWEGNIGLTMGTYDKKNMTGHFIEGMMRTSFDADRKMVVSQQSLMYDGQPIEQTVINDYNAQMMYIAKKDGTCTASRVEASLPFCIPDNATQTAMVNFGFGDNLVNSNTFEVKFDTFTLYIAVTSDTCIPLTEAIVGGDDNGSRMESLNYSSMKAGIADASVFNIPLTCSTALVQPALPGIGKRSIFH